MAASVLRPLSMMLLLLAAFLMGTGIASPNRPGHCETNWTYFAKTGACYKQFYGAYWGQAEDYCQIKRGHLASIHSKEENAFVSGLATTGLWLTNNKDYTWIGLTRTRDWKSPGLLNSKTWAWTDGTPVDFLAWAKGRPDNKGIVGPELCTQIFADEGPTQPNQKWNDLECDMTIRSFICKKKAK